MKRIDVKLTQSNGMLFIEPQTKKAFAIVGSNFSVTLESEYYIERMLNDNGLTFTNDTNERIEQP